MMLSENNYVSRVVLVVICVLVASCVTESVTTKPAMKFSDTAVVSVKDSGASIATGSSFSWLPEAVRFYDDDRLNDATVKASIENEIIENIKSNGMKVVESAGRAQYVIGYTAALESSLADSDIIQHYGLLPGKVSVADNTSEVEKGSLIIYVINTSTDRVVWRAAAQVGVHFDTPAEERRARVKQVVAEMFQTFPVAE